MIYLLIDTSSIKGDLIDKLDFSQELTQLLYWNKHNDVTILVPEILEREWNKHKTEEKNRINKAIRNHEKDVKKLNLLGQKIDLDKSDLDQANSELTSQIDSIQKLIDSGIKITTDDESKIRQVDHKEFKRAPFKLKDESDYDALLIFSALQYCTLKKIPELYFISANTDEFNEDNKTIELIHKDIGNAYPNVSIKYYHKTRSCFEELGKKIGRLPLKEIQLPAKLTRTYEVDENDHIIDQVWKFLNSKLAEINYLPVHLIFYHPPFQTLKSPYASFSQFSLEINNEKLINVLKSISVEPGKPIVFNDENLIHGVKNPKDKIQDIMSKISANLVFWVYKDRSDNISTAYTPNPPPCDCIKCQLNSFDYVRAFKTALKSNSNDINDLIEEGYILYKFGAYIEASKRLIKARKKASKGTRSFIIEYNLDKISRFIPNWKKENNEILTEIGEINLEQLEESYKHKEGREVRKWILENRFISNSRNEINTIRDKIIDQYYSTLNGGSSSNGFHNNLRFEYVKLIQFLELNNIVFDSFDEFGKTTKSFFQGVIASLAITNEQNSSLDFLDKWLMEQMINRADPNELIKSINRYKLRAIEYSGSHTELISRFIKHFNQFEEIFKMVNSIDSLSLNFILKFEKISQNIIIVLAMLNLKRHQLNLVNRSILSFLKQRNSTSLDGAIEFLLIRKKDQISIEVYQELIRINFPVNGKNHPWILSQVVFNLQELNWKINSTFGKWLINKIEKNINTESIQLIACEIHAILSNQGQRGKNEKLIAESLRKTFNQKVYYLASLYNIIVFNEEFLTKYATLCIPKANIDVLKLRSYKESFNSLSLSRSQKRFMQVDEFINVVFSLRVKLEGEYKERIQRLNNYYKWIVDIEAFNYDFFNPEWINEYQTRFYYREFYQSDKLKIELERFIKSEDSYNSQKVLNSYLNIYLRKTWEKG